MIKQICSADNLFYVENFDDSVDVKVFRIVFFSLNEESVVEPMIALKSNIIPLKEDSEGTYKHKDELTSLEKEELLNNGLNYRNGANAN